jgi:hypothetical protein
VDLNFVVNVKKKRTEQLEKRNQDAGEENDGGDQPLTQPSQMVLSEYTVKPHAQYRISQRCPYDRCPQPVTASLNSDKFPL